MKMNFWVLKDTVTNTYYVDAGLELGELNRAVILRTTGSVKDGISKRRRYMRRDYERKVYYVERQQFASERINLPDCGIVAIPFEVND